MSLKDPVLVNELLKLMEDMDPSDLRHISQTSYKMAERVGRAKLYVGAKVCFTHSRTGARIEGTVDRINPKKVIVNTGQDQNGRTTGHQIQWTVPPAMLEVLS